MPITLEPPVTATGHCTTQATAIEPITVPARHGGLISLPGNGYRFFGAADLPVVVVLGGISAGQHVARGEQGSGWWESMVGPRRAIDTRCNRVLGMDWAWRSDGPVDTADQAEILAAILDRENIANVAAIVGSSYGGMVALSFAARHPRRVARLVTICAAHNSHPMATAIRVVQRRIIQLARSAGKPEEGVALARVLGITTYRTAEEFAERFDSTAQISGSEVRFPVEEYLDAQGSRFAGTFSDAKYLSLSESLDLHQVDPSLIETATTLVAIDRDTLVPPRQMRELFASLKGPGRFVEISSPYGHDGFLKEVVTISDILTRVLGGRHGH